MSRHNSQCFASHMGLWMIQWEPFQTACALIAKGHDLRMHGSRFEPVAMEDEDDEPRKRDPYQIVDGVAIVTLYGSLSPRSNKYGTATVEARSALRKATRDSRVNAIMLDIRSPGGTVAGTGDLGDDIRTADRLKPVYAHAEEVIASAAYWAGAQARRLSASAHTLVGSIGVYAVTYDTSEMMKMEGVRPILIRAGEHKGDFAEGLPITKEMIERYQTYVDEINDGFVRAVAKGRGAKIDTVREWNTGDTWSAAKAKEMGLIDEVESLDEALAAVQKDLKAASKAKADAAERNFRVRSA